MPSLLGLTPVTFFRQMTIYREVRLLPTSTFNFTGDLQPFIVPPNVCSITIKAVGARGGNSSNPPAHLGGQGASIQGDFSVTPNEVLQVLVGGIGTDGTFGGGGGGGSFVWIGNSFSDLTTSSILVAAGGGGGSLFVDNGIDASLTTSGTNGSNGSAGTGGANGLGGTGGTNGTGLNSGGGAGIIGDGGDGVDGSSGTGGIRINFTAAGGIGFVGVDGGFAGGGGGIDCINCPTPGFISGAGGGGGGYSGGGGGSFAGGGGGSFNGGINQVNMISSEDAVVTITFEPDTEPPTITCPESITAQNHPGQSGADVPFEVTATDNCGLDHIMCTIDGIPQPPTPCGGATICPTMNTFFFTVGVHNVSCIATDIAGNVSDPCSFTVTVNPPRPREVIRITNVIDWTITTDTITVQFPIPHITKEQ